MNVLHVTTDLGETDVLRRELRAVDPDLRLECAATISDAIERLEAGTNHHDAVLFELAQMNGESLSLVSHIRKNNLPLGVVAITSERDEGPSQEILKIGVDHFVVRGKEFLTRLPVFLARAVAGRTLEARLRVMLETAPVCLMRVAADGTILAMNLAALDMVDAERAEQLVDQSWYERVAPEAQAACRNFIERASNGENSSLECRIERLSGTQRTVLMSAVRAPVDGSRAPSALVVMRDQDRTRGLETGLEQYRQQLGALETALGEAAAQNQQLVARHEAELAEAQERSTALASERMAWEQAEATRRQAVVEEHQAERENLESALQAAAAQCQRLATDQEAARVEWQQQLQAADAQCQQLVAEHDAARTEWQQQLAAAKALEGGVVEPLGAERARIESAPKAADAQRRRSADLASERMAWEPAEATRRQALVDEQQTARDAMEGAGRALQDYDVGADIEKLAATIVTQSDVVLDSLPERNPRREAAAGAALTHQLLAIGRKDRRAPRTMDLNAAIGRLDPVLCRLVGKDIELAVEPASRLDPVQVDPEHVEQLLLRLAVVVRDAMPAGGVVRLGTSSVEIDDAHVREHPGVPPGQYAQLTWKASGWGMDPQVQDRVSSAAAGGDDAPAAKELGLASALRAFRHGGCRITVEVEPGRELVFIGYLPSWSGVR